MKLENYSEDEKITSVVILWFFSLFLVGISLDLFTDVGQNHRPLGIFVPAVIGFLVPILIALVVVATRFSWIGVRVLVAEAFDSLNRRKTAEATTSVKEEDPLE